MNNNETTTTEKRKAFFDDINAKIKTSPRPCWLFYDHDDYSDDIPEGIRITEIKNFTGRWFAKVYARKMFILFDPDGDHVVFGNGD